MFVEYDVNTYSPVRSEADKVLIVPTDSKKVNEMLDGGIMTGDFYLIPASSGAGKTTFLQRLMLRVILAGYDAAFVSLGEQKPEVLYEKLMCMTRRKYYNAYRTATDEERQEFYDKLMLPTSNFSELKDRIHYYYTRDPFEKYKLEDSKKTTNDMTEIFKVIREKNIKFVFVDYVGSDTAEGEIGRTQLKRFCDKLNYFAEEHNVCVVGAIQTNRKYDEEEGKGELDATKINSSYVADSVNTVRKSSTCIAFVRNKVSDEAILTIFKSRNGKLGFVKVYIEPYTYRWSDEPLKPFEK